MYSIVLYRAGDAAAPEAFNQAPHIVGTIINRGWQPIHADTPEQHAQHAATCEGGTRADVSSVYT